MRTPFLYPVAGALLLLCGAAMAQSGAPAVKDDSAAEGVAYPAQVALSEETGKGFIYRRFPGSQRLYIYDLDKNGQSACNLGCDGARPPVYAPSTSRPVGQWTILRRYDGTSQWAYKGKPVYTYYHDVPNDPQGDNEGGVWHLLGYEPKPDTH